MSAKDKECMDEGAVCGQDRDDKKWLGLLHVTITACPRLIFGLLHIYMVFYCAITCCVWAFKFYPLQLSIAHTETMIHTYHKTIIVDNR